MSSGINVARPPHSRDTACSSLSALEKLQRLKERQNAWKNPKADFVRSFEVPSQGDLGFNRYIIDGVYVHGFWEGTGHDGEFNKLYVHLTDVVQPGEPLQAWTLALPNSYRDLGIDASQDLLIVIEFTMDHRRLHFLSLRHGTPHPDASFAWVHVDANDRWKYHIQIRDNLVAFVASIVPAGAVATESKIDLINWKTGEKKQVVVESGLHAYIKMCLLSNRQFLVASFSNPSDEDLSFVPRISVYNLADLSWKLVATHELPLIMPVRCNPGHGPSAAILTFSLAPPCNRSRVYPDLRQRTQPLFQASPSPSLLVVGLWVGGPYNEEYTFFMSSAIFTAYAEPSARECVTVPWKSWGTCSTRWFQGLLDEEVRDDENFLQNLNFSERVYGQRVALSSRIFDFNSLDIARDLSRETNSAYKNHESKGYIFRPESGWREEFNTELFTEEVADDVSTLPCRVIDTGELSNIQFADEYMFLGDTSGSRLHMCSVHDKKEREKSEASLQEIDSV